MRDQRERSAKSKMVGVASPSTARDGRDVTRLLSASCMVRCTGRDPTERKTSGRAFFKCEFGFTSLSASGLLLDRHLEAPLVLTTASLIAPFLEPFTMQTEVSMLEGSSLHIRLRDAHQDETSEHQEWLPVRLVAIADAKGAEDATRALALGNDAFIATQSPHM